jgi:uncharacterized protein YjbI with pentapeptide repeats
MTIRNRAGDLLFESETDELLAGDLDGQNLRDADLPGVDFGGSMLMTDTVLAYANLVRANLYWCGLISVDLSHANLEQACLQGTNLVNCNFRFANLKGANFGPSNLGGPTTISGCDFTGADLAAAVFQSVVYDYNTKFPEGFDPIRHDMIPADQWRGKSWN